MKKQQPSAMKKQQPSAMPVIVPYFVLGLMLAASVSVWRYAVSVEETRAQIHFKEYCKGVSQGITDRINVYERLIYSGAGISVASQYVSRQEWRTHYEYHKASSKLPGMQAFAFAKVVPTAQLSKHVDEVRAEGLKDYSVWPEGERQSYTPIVFVEPLDKSNIRALGYDLASEPVRRAAMERARDSAQGTMSDTVGFAENDPGEYQTCHLIYVPVYHGGVPPAGLEARRSALKGYAFVALRVKDLMQGIFVLAPEKVAFELYDGLAILPKALLFSSSELRGAVSEKSRARFSIQTPLEFHGHTWSLIFRSTPRFEAGEKSWLSWLILGAGFTVSILIFLLLRAQQWMVNKAKRLAAKLTVDLNKSEETLRTTLYSIGDAVISTDAQSLIVSMNPVAESLTSWSEKLATGQLLSTVFRIINEKTGMPVQNPAQRIMNEGPIEGLANDSMLLARDGRKIPISVSGAPIRSVSGAVTGIVLVFRDQTEEREINQSLVNSRQHLESMFQAAPVGIGLANGDIIAGANDLLCEITGYASREMIGRSARMLYPSRDKYNGSIFEKSDPFEKNAAGANETVWMRKDGTLVDILLGASPVDRSDAAKGVTFTALDITDQKRAVADRIAREEAEQANRAKSVFLSSMSHEIRTPLNAVLGFAQILERDASLTPRQSGMLQTIARSGRHLLNLINDILDTSQIEAGKLELCPVDFCFHDVLDDLELMFNSRANASQLQVIMEWDEIVPRYLNADEGKLRQVLINLVGNAIKFTKVGGIAVRVRSEPVTSNSPADSVSVRLIIEVEDSGPGIIPADLERIFEPFQQSAAGRDAGGTGLGLALSRRIVELMGGTLTVKSRVNVGSCFRFDALVKLAKRAPLVATALAQQVVGLEPGSGPIRILVVDDQKDNRDLLLALLEPIGFEVKEAVNGQEALDEFEMWSPHAILMDMRMPTLDGYEVTRRIKSTKKGRLTPVIAVTASAFVDTEREVLATGVDGFVRKPFRPEEIFNMLAKCKRVRYVYSQRSAYGSQDAGVMIIGRGDLLKLPEPLQQAMRQAVEEGDMAGLQELIARFEQIDPVAAVRLKNLAEQYDYETLTHVFAKQREGESNE